MTERMPQWNATLRWPLRLAAGGLVLLLALALALSLLGASAFAEFPQALNEETAFGRRIEDRDGQLLARMTASGVFHAPLRLAESGPYLAPAMIAAEDKRFYSHLGVDPLAVARAACQALVHGKLVSGASTITQQLARTTFERQRTLLGKWREMALALKLERELSKDQLLEHYLNRVHFGPNIVGARAAADHYFGKPLSALDLAEAATLAGLVRGPGLYNPTQRPALAERRRNRVLSRMVSTGLASAAAADRARALTLELHPRPPLPGAHHWVRVVAKEAPVGRLRTTLNGLLQRDVEASVAGHRRSLMRAGGEASAAAAIVLDNRNGEILAYVGAPDYFDQEHGGQNDGVAALRQPGSTLKPFIYAQSIDDLGLTSASLLPDKPLQFRTPGAFYSPKNFDRKFRQTVLLRRALANSLNVPAVYLLEKLGEARVLTRLRAAGLSSLTEHAAHYGPALALGDGEVTLRELAAAYACLARGGTTVTPRLLLGAPTDPTQRVFSPAASALITEILSDDIARREAFGARNALDLPFPVAVKTGTSKGYRDNWTVGYTRAITVGVWVGNFDGRPTQRLTGATAAGPLFHAVMEASRRRLGERVTESGTTRPLHDVSLERARVCADTGAAAVTGCERTIDEWFAPGGGPGAAGLVANTEVAGVEFPKDGMVFRFDPAVPASRQKLILRAVSPSDLGPATLLLNGAKLPTIRNQAEWEVRPGVFKLSALTAAGETTEPVSFVVNSSPHLE